MIWGTQGNPGTVAPFRAWRGSRDLVAQSPKFHAPAVPQGGTAYKIVAQQSEAAISSVPTKIILLVLPLEESLLMDLPSSP